MSEQQNEKLTRPTTARDAKLSNCRFFLLSSLLCCALSRSPSEPNE